MYSIQWFIFFCFFVNFTVKNESIAYEFHSLVNSGLKCGDCCEVVINECQRYEVKSPFDESLGNGHSCTTLRFSLTAGYAVLQYENVPLLIRHILCNHDKIISLSCSGYGFCTIKYLAMRN